jgi:hypothetical protein
MVRGVTMAIRSEQITSDITLEIDEEEISLADFNAACEAFSGLVKEVSRHVSVEASAKSWTVKVYEGSYGLGLTARPSLVALNAVDLIRDEIAQGITQLTKGVRPECFSDRAIEFARNLASTFKSKPVEPSIRIWSGRQSAVRIGRKVAATAKALLEPAYQQESSIEGILEKVDGHDKRMFVVYDLIDDRAIKCEVDEDLLEEALRHWKRRIEVLGTVRYRPDGQPVSIRAKTLVPFPEPSEIPSLEEMRALLAGDHG